MNLLYRIAIGLSLTVVTLSSGCRAPVADASPNGDAVEAVLDRFYQTASTGDFDGYFDLFHEDGVFLGTDGGERWTVAEFKKFARPHFKDGTAWSFEPKTQNVTLGPSGRFAWFDEVLESKSYGVCRGSGVAIRTESGWKIGQYNLTVPIPNDLLRDFVARIRGETQVTRIIAVRHAEKVKTGDDPVLTPLGRKRAKAIATVLRDVPIDQVFATQFQRTQLTAGPVAATHELKPEIVPAAKFAQLAARIKKDFVGKTVLYAGHSNTVPQLVRALGVETVPALADGDYDNVFVVTLRPGDAPTVMRLHVPVEE